MIGHYAFGSKLRMQRERQGISLASIAESSKIKLSLLDGLERGDVSQWPRGLFRRAYLRDYAAAIGLPADPLVAEFTRLYPEDGPPVSPADLAEAAEPLRLSFPSAAEAGPLRPFEPLSGAGAELLLVAVVGLGIALLRGHDPLTTCGGNPRTGRPRVSSRPVWRASASPSLMTRTTYLVPFRKPPPLTTSTSLWWP